MREKIASDNERSIRFKEDKQIAYLERLELTKQMQIEKKRMLEKFERMKKKGRLTQMGGLNEEPPLLMSKTVYVKKRRMSEGGGAAGGLSLLDTTAEQTQILRSTEGEEERKIIPMRKKLSPIVTKKGPILKRKLEPRKQSLQRGVGAGLGVGHSRSNTITMKPLGGEKQSKLRLDFKRALRQTEKVRVESSYNTLQKESPGGRRKMTYREQWSAGLEGVREDISTEGKTRFRINGDVRRGIESRGTTRSRTEVY